LAKEAFDPDSYNWTRDFIGPPADPSYNWQIRNSTNDHTLRLYMNFFDSPEKSFFKTFEAMKQEADAHWVEMWGGIQAGPFNTECLADGTSHTRPTGNTCVDKPEPLPPVPRAVQ
jgi:hypothetical protein